MCNGPGICLIVAVTALVVAVISGQKKPKIVYIESFARCRSLSLTGKLMRCLASKFYVQWPGLVAPQTNIFCSQTEHIGVLV